MEKDKKALTRNLDDLFAQLNRAKQRESDLLAALKDKAERVNKLTENVIKLKSELSILRRNAGPLNGNRTAWK